MRVGAHVSIAGGVENAPDNAKDLGCDVFQLFCKNQRQWAAKPLTEENVRLFKERFDAHGFGPALVHATYLLNLASPDDALWEKSIAGLALEVERADALGVPWVVFHPGSSRDKERPWGVKRVVEGVNEVFRRTPDARTGLLFETNAGAGNSVGRTFEELAEMCEGVAEARRAGVCLDTCHVFVAGYPVHTEEGYAETFDSFASIVGLDRLKAFHLNDSKAAFGSNKDRHENLGDGLIGADLFRWLQEDDRFREVPGYCETPGGDDGYRADLKLLRSFA